MIPGFYFYFIFLYISFNIYFFFCNLLVSNSPSPSFVNSSRIGVTGPEQMYLLAIIDTYKQMMETHGALDERGVRFLLAVKIYAFMRRSLTGGILKL
jgi:hypothetical protein